MREDTVMKQQQRGLAVTNSDSVNSARIFIPNKYNTCMNLKKINRTKYFTKSLLEIRAWGFIAEELSSCANIIAAAEKLIMWHKSLPAYIEGDEVYI